MDPSRLNACQAQRDQMIRTQLVARGVGAPGVLEAMRRVPREWFVAGGSVERAYEDAALPVDCGQTISQPYIVARMTEALEPGPQDRVLEIGTGTGYQTAVLALLAGQVYTIEWYAKLLVPAAERLAALGIRNVTFRCGDGSEGWPEHAPYDGILVTAGAPRPPLPLLEQLAVGGRMVLPVGPPEEESLLVIRRTAAGYEQRELLRCRFVPLRGREGWPDASMTDP